MTPVEQRVDEPIEQPCCDAWAKAHEWRTDNEGYGELVYYEDGARIGKDLPPVKFCPWCASSKQGARV